MANESFSDRVLSALESGEWLTWSQLCLATDLTLFWVRETLDSLVEEGMVEVSGDAVFKFRLVCFPNGLGPVGDEPDQVTAEMVFGKLDGTESAIKIAN